jgi:hypothetical protein
MTTHMSQVGGYRDPQAVLLVQLSALTKLIGWLFVDEALVPRDKYQLVFLDFVAAGARYFGCGRIYRSLHNYRRFCRAHYVKQRCASHKSNKEHGAIYCALHPE